MRGCASGKERSQSCFQPNFETVLRAFGRAKLKILLKERQALRRKVVKILVEGVRSCNFELVT
jgi:hypothetical protein